MLAESLRANVPEFVSDTVTPDDVVSTDHDLFISNMGSLAGEDILAEFEADNLEQEDTKD